MHSQDWLTHMRIQLRQESCYSHVTASLSSLCGMAAISSDSGAALPAAERHHSILPFMGLAGIHQLLAKLCVVQLRQESCYSHVTASLSLLCGVAATSSDSVASLPAAERQSGRRQLLQVCPFAAVTMDASGRRFSCFTIHA